MLSKRLLLVVAAAVSAVALFSVVGTPTAHAVDRPDAPDLEVSYIERTPRQARLCPNGLGINLTACQPDGPNPATEDGWPDPGQDITYWAHIKNKGTQPSVGGTYTWYYDDGSGGEEVGNGTIPDAPIAPGDERLVALEYAWPDPPDHSTHDYPRVRIEIDASGTEAFESNNTRTHYVLGKNFVFFIREATYDLMNESANGDCAEGSSCPTGQYVATFSYEDWLQRQFWAMNSLMRDSDVDVEGGSRERVNLEEVVVVPQEAQNYVAAWEDTLETGSSTVEERLYKYDAAWHTTGTGDPHGEGAYLHRLTVEYGLIHEMSHQLGAVDIYNIPFVDHGSGCTHGLMGGSADLDCDRGHLGLDDYEAVHVRSFNRKLPYRAGLYGEFLLETPNTSIVEFKDDNGQPLVNAEVTAWQPNGHQQPIRPNIYLWTLRTDANGRLTLPNRTVAPKTSPTGYQLQNNPFGEIHQAAFNAHIFLEVTAPDGATDTVILDLPWLNEQAALDIEPGLFPFDTSIVPLAQSAPVPTVSLAASTGSHPWLRPVNATVSANTDRVDFYVDGVLKARDTSAPFEHLFDTRFVATGTRVLSARAYDMNGAAVSSYALSAPLNVNVVQLGDNSAQAAAQLGSSPAASVGASSGFLNLDGTALASIADENVATEWYGLFSPNGYVEVDLGSTQTVGGARISTANNVSDKCPEFELFVSNSSPPAPDELPVVIDKNKDLAPEEQYIFAPRAARYIRYVCTSGGTERMSELQAILPKEAPANIKSLMANLVSPTAGASATSTGYLWTKELPAYYYRLCTDSSATGAFTTCVDTSVSLFGLGFGLDSLPSADGTVRYAKVRSCNVFDVCSAPSTIFAGVARSTQGSTDYVYSFDRRTADTAQVGVSSLTTAAPLRVDIAQGTNGQAAQLLGNTCVDSSNWSKTITIPAWKLLNVIAAVHSAPASCAGSSTGGFSTARSATPPMLPDPPHNFRLTLSPDGERGVDLSWDHGSFPAPLYRVCYAAVLYATDASLRCTTASATTTAHVSTTDAFSFPQGSAGVNRYYWVQSCDASAVCGANSRSYGFVGRRSPFGNLEVYDWAYYKNGNDFKFHMSNSSFSSNVISMEAFAGGDVNAPQLFGGPICAAPGTTTAQYAIVAADYVSPTITVRRHRLGGTSCPNNDGTLLNDNVDTKTVRMLPAAPVTDFAFDDTGTSPNQYRLRLHWPDDPGMASYKYCTGSSATGSFNCPSSLWLPRTYQLFNLPSAGGSPTYYRTIACDVERVCSPKSNAYVHMQRGPVSYVWNFTFAYRRTSTEVKLQMVNTSVYLGAQLWVKLHALDGPASNDQIVSGLDVCSRNAAGQGPISAPAVVARSSFSTNTISLENHVLGEIAAASCAAADTNPTSHTNDGDLGSWTGQLDEPSP